jgi:beta-glucosidase
MTLTECIAQLQQTPLNQITDAALRSGLGSVILAGSATAGNVDGEAGNGFSGPEMNRLQPIAIEESRLGIPFITGRDIIHGHYTIFPIPLGQAAAWDADLVREGSRAAAVECSADGVHWTFSPMMDISRDPRWGRMAECYGESTLLNVDLSVAAVEGYQGADLAAVDSIAACAKHFVGYGAAEGGRDYNSTEITTTTLQDVYLPPFEAVTQAGCATFMTSFNEIGGVPSCANKPLVDDLLRGSWGFDGFVVTDWAAVWELVEHGVAEDTADAALQALWQVRTWTCAPAVLPITWRHTCRPGAWTRGSCGRPRSVFWV